MCRKLLILAHDLPPYSSGVGSYMRVVTLGTFFKQAGFNIILFGASKNKSLIQYLKSSHFRSGDKPEATRPNEYGGMDMTKFILGSLGCCYLIVVLDWYTKKIVGWKLSLRGKTSEWKEALDRALCQKFPFGVRGQGLNLISDNGSQPNSVAFMIETAGLGINQIFCSYDNPRGNAEV